MRKELVTSCAHIPFIVHGSAHGSASDLDFFVCNLKKMVGKWKMLYYAWH